MSLLCCSFFELEADQLLVQNTIYLYVYYIHLQSVLVYVIVYI